MNKKRLTIVGAFVLAASAAAYGTVGAFLREVDKHHVRTGTDMKLEDGIFAPFNVEPAPK